MAFAKGFKKSKGGEASVAKNIATLGIPKMAGIGKTLAMRAKGMPKAHKIALIAGAANVGLNRLQGKSWRQSLTSPALAPNYKEASVRVLLGKMANVLSTEERKDLPKSELANPKKEGEESGSYPIPDKAHARNALARVSQHGSPAMKAKVRAKVHKEYPDIGKGK